MNVKKMIASIAYTLYRLPIVRQPFDILSIEDTISLLLNPENRGIVRFGDGEFKLISGKSISNQTYSEELGQRLYRIISNPCQGLLISLPDIFNSVDQFVPSSRDFWKEHLLFHRKDYITYCPKGTYGNSFISRPYIMYKNKEVQAQVFSSAKRLWDSRDIVFVEGDISHNGVDNDLFDNATSIKRIIAPSENAFEKYDEILTECLKLNKNDLILVTLGAAGKVLTYDLAEKGYHVLDIGSLDMEYGWYMEGATQKCRVPKHEIKSLEDNIAAGYTQYLEQIIATLLPN